MPSLRFTDDELDRFARTSHDRNPLHLCAAYARRTAFGRRIVFGVLALLRAISLLPRRPGQRLSSVAVDFLGPLFTEVAYDVDISERASKTTLRIRDGGRVLLKAVLGSQVGDVVRGPAALAVAQGRQAAERVAGDLPPGSRWCGAYWPEDLDGFANDLSEHGLCQAHTAALLACTYVVGMQLPGERALFTRLELDFAMVSAEGPLACEAEVIEYDERFDLLRTRVRLGEVARGELRALLRRAPIEIDVPRLCAQLDSSRPLDGKVAVVVGASRGLGAATALGLRQLGATVVGTYARSSASAGQLGIHAHCVDARDATAMGAFVEGILREYGRIDALVCSAAPPVLPLSISTATADRISEFVAQSVKMVAPALGAALPFLTATGGCAAIVSSGYVDEAPSEFPHYVAAKAALEGLVHSCARAAKGMRFVVARAPRFLSDMTNLGSIQSCERVEDVAARLCAALVAAREPLQVVTLAPPAPAPSPQHSLLP